MTKEKMMRLVDRLAELKELTYVFIFQSINLL